MGGWVGRRWRRGGRCVHRGPADCFHHEPEREGCVDGVGGWVGGWVGWVEEEEAVGMRCWVLGLGWVEEEKAV